MYTAMITVSLDHFDLNVKKCKRRFYTILVLLILLYNKLHWVNLGSKHNIAIELYVWSPKTSFMENTTNLNR